MKKNKTTLFIIFFVLIFIGLVVFFYLKKDMPLLRNQQSDEAERLSAEIQANEEASEKEYKQEHPDETEIASYSTILKDKASGRINNIKITCDTLNGYIVKVGDEFSFESIVGPATSAKGYQKAKVIENGKTVQALGGGNCQVSSTLYNAILEVPDLEVTERHPHGKKVTYVPEGKDAAVSHGSYDLKFVNNTPDDIKMYLSTDEENVYVTLVKLTY